MGALGFRQDRLRRRTGGLLLAGSLLLGGCESSEREAAGSDPGQVCTHYPSWQSSEYVLPYPVGSAYRVSQGNCTSGSHQGLLRYAYDWEMPIGSPVTAMRDGLVVFLREEYRDGDFERWHSNLVQIRHPDGTYAVYEHLTYQGVAVEVGQWVRQGQLLGWSGNTGYTLGLPHLHVDLAPCTFWGDCGSLPFTFRNTDPNPLGLEEGRVYPAYAY